MSRRRQKKELVLAPNIETGLTSLIENNEIAIANMLSANDDEVVVAAIPPHLPAILTKLKAVMQLNR